MNSPRIKTGHNQTDLPCGRFEKLCRELLRGIVRAEMYKVSVIRLYAKRQTVYSIKRGIKNHKTIPTVLPFPAPDDDFGERFGNNRETSPAQPRAN
jgi:hypothetical protein